MEQKPSLELTRVKILFPLKFRYIKDIIIKEHVNTHGEMHVTLISQEKITNEDLVRVENALIQVTSDDNSIIFSGNCVAIEASYENEHCKIDIKAMGHTINADIAKKNRTFQDTSKMLSQVVKEVLSPYGIAISIPKDTVIPQMLSQNNETDWEFVKRISNQYGNYIFTNNKYGEFCFSVGALPFSESVKDVSTPISITKDIDTYLAVKQNINPQCNLFEFIRKNFITSDLTIGVGHGILGDSRLMVVISSEISYKKGEFTNKIILAYIDGLYYAPISSVEDVKKEGKANEGSMLSGPNVLTGTVLAVKDNDIQVSFNSESSGSSSRWISYNSFFGVDFYCMPDIGDTVFCYFENEGDIICLGSKHINTTHPDFLNPENKVFTANNSMIKHKKDGTDITANRNEMDGYGGNQVKITLSDSEGISVNATKDINIDADSNILVQANDLNIIQAEHLEWFNVKHKEQRGRFQAELQAGIDLYNTSSGASYNAAWALSEIVGGNLLEGVAGVVTAPFQIVSTLFGSGESVPEEMELITFEEIDTYQINILGLNKLKIHVEDSIIEFTHNTIDVSTNELKWLGLKQRSNYPEVSESQRTGLDSILDAVQLGIDLIGLIPGVSVVCGAINTVASLARGDYFGAVCGIASMIPGGGLALKGIDAAAGLLDTAADTSKVLKNLRYLSAGSQITNAVILSGQAIYNNRDTLFDKNHTLEDLDVWVEVFGHTMTAFDQADSVRMKLNNGPNTNGSGDAAGDTRPDNQNDHNNSNRDNNDPPTNTDRAETNSTDQQPDNQNTCGDPIDVVTGSQKLVQKDLVIYDLLGDFSVERTYQSIYKNEHTLLGSKWHLNIGSWLTRKDDTIKIMMPNMRIEEFHLTGDIWVNKRKLDKSVQLSETKTEYVLNLLLEDRLYVYDRIGNLQYISDNKDNRIKFTYNHNFLIGIEFPSNQSLKVTYKGSYVETITDSTGRQVKYSYDNDLLKAVSYPNKGVVEYFYTAEGYLSSVIDQRGCEYVKNFYDNKGRVTRQILSNGLEYILLYDDVGRQNTFLKPQTDDKTIYTYNKDELVTSIGYSDGTTEEYEYDENQNKCKIKDKSGNVIHREYNTFGCMVKEELPNGLITMLTYDEDTHKLVMSSNNSGSITKFRYDSYQNIIQIEHLISDDLWQEVYFSYDKLGRMTSYTMANNKTIYYHYDKKNVKPSRIVTAEGNEFAYEIDELQREASITNANGETKYAYNMHNFLSYVIDPLGNHTQYYYDKLGNLTNFISPHGYKEQGENIGAVYTYDDFDQLIKKVDEAENIYATPRDLEGNILKEINPNTYDRAIDDGEGVSYEYDSNDRKTKIIYPDGSIERIKYDANGNIIKKIQPEQYNLDTDDGIGYTYLYDEVNRLVQITDPENNTTKRYIYDLKGNITKEINAQGYLTADNDNDRIGNLYQYNYMGWLTEKRTPIIQENDKTLYSLLTYIYDKSGNMTQEQRYVAYQSKDSYHGDTHTISFTYDKDNRRIGVNDNTGAVMQYSYNGIGQVITEKRKINTDIYQETFYSYDKAGRLIEVRTSADEKGCGKKSVVTKYSYDANGNITKIETPSKNEIVREYDLVDRLISETHKEKQGKINNRTEFSYDKASNLVGIIDGNGRKTAIEYDLLNREIRVTEKDGGITRKFYHPNGQLSKVIRPNQYEENQENGQGYLYTYDLKGQITTVIAPNGTVLQTNTYNALGNLISQVDGTNSGVSFTYDLVGNRLEIETKGGAKQSFGYDARGNIIGTNDGEDNKTQYTLDKWGRITAIQKADGTGENYKYDCAGNMLSSTDGEGHTTNYTYTKTGKVSEIIDPMGGIERYSYNEENHLIEKTDRNGIATQYGYNLYGAPTYHREKDGTLQDSYTYTSDGLLESAISHGMQYNYSYDVMNRLASKKASGRTLIAYGYDKNGNKTTETDVTGKITQFSYNSLDLLENISHNNSSIADYDYYPNGMVKSLKNGSLEQDYSYDLDHNLIGLQVKKGAEILANNHYNYDGNGNRTQKQTLNGVTDYAYSQVGQLTQVDYPSYSEELFYDKRGNRTKRIKNGAEELYSYDPRNRLTELTKNGQTTAFDYDNAGNLLKDDKASYSYDGFNRTTKVETFDGNIQINRYDAEGLRYEMEENNNLVQFIFNQNREVIAEKETTWTSYIRGSTLLASSAEHARTYYHYASDEMSSVTHIVDDEKVLNEYEYDAWGEVVSSTETVSNRFKFNGQKLDPITQQYYLRARFYNPVIARFTQEDTYRGDGLNLYAYCRNNPVYYVDPTGNARNCVKEAYDEIRTATASEQRKIESYDRIEERLGGVQGVVEYSRLREQGLGAAEAMYIVTPDRNPLNNIGSNAMIQREIDTIMAHYQNYTSRAYSTNASSGKANVIGTKTHKNVADEMKLNYLPDNLHNMPYLDKVSIERGYKDGVPDIYEKGSSRPDMVITTKTNSDIYFADIKTGKAEYKAPQQRKNERNVVGAGNVSSTNFIHYEVKPNQPYKQV